jgi:hypothetical protein
LTQPGRVTLPITLAPSSGCVLFDVDAPSFVSAANVYLQQTGRVAQGQYDDPVAVAPGEVLTCTGSLYVVTTIEFVTPTAVSTCLDEHRWQNPTGAITACSDDTRCAVVLGGSPSCRALAGAPCDPVVDSCLGMCEVQPDGTGRCIDEQSSNAITVGTCDDRGRFHRRSSLDQDAAPIVVACAERCEHRLGCLASAGHGCGPYTRCIDPTDNVTMLDCPEAGVCPE